MTIRLLLLRRRLHQLRDDLADAIARRLPRKVSELTIGEALTRWDLAGTKYDRPEPAEVSA